MQKVTPIRCPIWCQWRGSADHGGDPRIHTWTGDDNTFALEPGVKLERFDTEDGKPGPVRVVLDLTAVDDDDTDDSHSYTSGAVLSADLSSRLAISMLTCSAMVADHEHDRLFARL